MNQLALDLRQEKARLSRQCEEILMALGKGRVSNHALVEEFALNYRARISDLRKRGHDIRVVYRNYNTGRVLYALFLDGEEARP